MALFKLSIQNFKIAFLPYSSNLISIKHLNGKSSLVSNALFNFMYSLFSTL